MVAAPAVLVLEDSQANAHPDNSVLRLFAASVEGLAPGLELAWKFRAIAPTDSSSLRAVVDETRPTIVVMLNDDLLNALGDRDYATRFLVPSELPPEQLHARFGFLRQRHQIALISWYAESQGRLLDLLAQMQGSAPGSVIGLFHTSLVKGGVVAPFVSASLARNIRPVETVYTDFQDFAQKARDAAARRPDAFYVPMSGAIFSFMPQVAALGVELGIPILYSRGDQVTEGGLISVEPLDGEVYDQIARYALLILNGAKASELEIARPSRLETTLNLKAAAAIGLTVPYEVLVQADTIVRR